MGLSDFKITDADITSKGVQASPDQLSGTAEDNKKVFDRLTSGPVRDGHNRLIDALIALGVAGVLPPATSALLHNGSTLGISLRNMTDLLGDEENPRK